MKLVWILVSWFKNESETNSVSFYITCSPRFETEGKRKNQHKQYEGS